MIEKNDGKTAYDIALEKGHEHLLHYLHQGSEHMMNKWSIGVFLFDDVEVLDFAGPFEVFSVTEADEEKPFTVYTVSQNGEMITARNGLKGTAGL